MLKCHLSVLAAQITFRQARKGGQVVLVAAVKLGVRLLIHLEIVALYLNQTRVFLAAGITLSAG